MKASVIAAILMAAAASAAPAPSSSTTTSTSATPVPDKPLTRSITLSISGLTFNPNPSSTMSTKSTMSPSSTMSSSATMKPSSTMSPSSTMKPSFTMPSFTMSASSITRSTSTSTTTTSLIDPTAHPDPPSPAEPERVYFLTLNATTSGMDPAGKPKHDTISVHLNHLATCKSFSIPTNHSHKANKCVSLADLEVTELAIVPGSGVNLNTKDVECRMYKDKVGTMPGSAGFTEAMPAHISTNPVAIGSILCYEVGSS